MDASQAPSGPWPEHRNSGSQTIPYKVERDPGGSGGEVIVLTAVWALEGRTLVAEFYGQSEPRDGRNLTVFWTLVDSVRLGPGE